MKETLRKEILAETYQDMQKLIYANAWDFWRIHGGDIDDLISQSMLIFIEACDTHNSDRAQLSTWISFKIKKGLLSYLRKRNKLHVQIDVRFFDMFSFEKNNKAYRVDNRYFSVTELIDEMGQDAHLILQLFFEIPKDVMVQIRNSHSNVCHVQAALRNRLYNRLRQLGWTKKRIKKAFDEIKNATIY